MLHEPRAGAVLFAKDVDRLTRFYSAVIGFQVKERHDDHVVLESPDLQLVVHRIPYDIASTIEVTVPPTRRANGAIKLFFSVPSIDSVRAFSEALGGVMNPTDMEWSYKGRRVCDGLDPEGNVIQFREQAE